MSESDRIEELIQTGKDAARDNDRRKAREAFMEAVKLDKENETAWFWLARVVDNDKERIAALKRVLDINPKNERARHILDRIELQTAVEEEDEEVLSGISRRLLTRYVGGGLAIILIIIVVFVIILVNQNNARQAAANATQSVIRGMTRTEVAIATGTADAVATGTALVQTVTAAAAGVTAEVTEEITPTVQLGGSRPTLPPTFTPTSEVDAVDSGIPPLAAPPAGAQEGVLIGSAGRDVTGLGYFPVVSYDLNSGATTMLGDEFDLSLDVQLFPTGGRHMFTSYDRNLNADFIEAVNHNNTAREILSERWRGYRQVLQPRVPRISADGSTVIFVATSQQRPADAQQALSFIPPDLIYSVDLNFVAPPLPPTPEGGFPPDAPPTPQLPSPINAVIDDGANYDYPDLSPDGSRVVAVRDAINSPTPGADLVIIDRASGAVTQNLTSDLDTNRETMPRWSPGGSRIAYVSAPQAEPDMHDLFVYNLDTGSAIVITVESGVDSDELYPVWSPDGEFLAFASNRSGSYDIYMYEFATDTVYQLTNSPVEQDFPGDWRIPDPTAGTIPAEGAAPDGEAPAEDPAVAVTQAN